MRGFFFHNGPFSPIGTVSNLSRRPPPRKSPLSALGPPPGLLPWPANRVGGVASPAWPSWAPECGRARDNYPSVWTPRLTHWLPALSGSGAPGRSGLLLWARRVNSLVCGAGQWDLGGFTVCSPTGSSGQRPCRSLLLRGAFSEWSIFLQAVGTAAAAADPTWPRGCGLLHPHRQRGRSRRGSRCPRLFCGHLACSCDRPPARVAEDALRARGWIGRWGPWAAATRGPPSAPAVAIMAWCRRSRATSASAAGGTARVPSAL